MLTHQRLRTCSPIKRLFNKLKTSIQTYINYYKTHAMATGFGGVGDTSMEDPDTQDIDNTRMIYKMKILFKTYSAKQHT